MAGPNIQLLVQTEKHGSRLRPETSIRETDLQ
jgi:hypothetical protein